MKKTIILLFFLTSILSFGQVTSVDYLMKYNCETNQYDVSLVILDGSASTIPERAQFNSQISIVVPNGEAIVIVDRYLPLQDNQNYDSTAPMNWGVTNPILAPDAQPESDFYSIVPQLSPASFYNDINEGEEVIIFSFTAGTTGQYDDRIRFFDNGIDPAHTDPGMNGSDFSNGFALGGASQLYNGNREEFCLTGIEDEIEISWNAYPNPFQHQLTIDLTAEARNLQILDSKGSVYYQIKDLSKGPLTINTDEYPSGIYYVQIETETGLSHKKMLKF